MNKFKAGLNNQIVRTTAGASYLAPTNNEQATRSLQVLDKVNAFIGHFTNTNGFSEYHPSLITNTVVTAQSLVTGETLTQTRGHGRLATVTDYVLNNGCGMLSASLSIEKLFGLSAEWIKDERTGICFPIVKGGLPKSSTVMRELGYILDERAKFADDKRIRKSTRDRLLLKTNWTDSRLIGYTIEWLSRAFAYQMDSEVRASLIKGDRNTSLKAAMDTLRFLPA